MKINIDELNKRKELGLLSCRKHPTEDLYIWNYTPQCQWENIWDEYTMICRGLITDGQHNIIARPMPKFFNINTTEDTHIENLPNEIPIITEKLDGSMGINYYINGKVYVATRGSFESEQALFATDWMQKRYTQKDFLEGYTYVTEIIYPENRIVVSYGDTRELRLIAVINNESLLLEIDHTEEARRIGMNYARIVNKSINEMVEYLKTTKENEEGFVLKYSGGLRIKAKSAEYFRLHRLVTGFSSRSIWECLMTGQDIESMLYAVPDEFMDWVRETKTKLMRQHADINYYAQMAMQSVEKLPTQKEKALVIMNEYKDISGLVFSLLKGHDIDKSIWKMIEPEFELPFKKEN